jgi:hypothetical protein
MSKPIAGGASPGNKLAIIRAVLNNYKDHPDWVMRSDFKWENIECWELADWQDLYTELCAIGHNGFDTYVLNMINYVSTHQYLAEPERIYPDWGVDHLGVPMDQYHYDPKIAARAIDGILIDSGKGKG